MSLAAPTYSTPAIYAPQVPMVLSKTYYLQTCMYRDTSLSLHLFANALLHFPHLTLGLWQLSHDGCSFCFMFILVFNHNHTRDAFNTTVRVLFIIPSTYLIQNSIFTSRQKKQRVRARQMSSFVSRKLQMLE